MKLVMKAVELVKRRGARYVIRRALALVDHRIGLVSLFLAPYIAYKLRRELNGVLALLFSDSLIGMLFRPMQVGCEVERLLKILKRLKPKYILEVGTARGGTLLLWTRVAAEDAVIVSIDIPRGPFGGGYPWPRKLVYKLFAWGRQRIVLIREDSHSLETLEEVKKVLGGNRLDFLFIDGDHSYEGVKKDYELYSSLIREGGIVALHDIVPGPSELVGGVPRFWNELKQGLKSPVRLLEIVKDWSQGGYGIGLIFKNTAS